MKRSTSIIQAAGAFALIGLCVAYLLTNNLPPAASDSRPEQRYFLLLVFGGLPPLIGAIVGLTIGVIAAVVGRFTDSPDGVYAGPLDTTQPYPKK